MTEGRLKEIERGLYEAAANGVVHPVDVSEIFGEVRRLRRAFETLANAPLGAPDAHPISVRDFARFALEPASQKPG
jgi:hypothetical protein